MKLTKMTGLLLCAALLAACSDKVAPQAPTLLEAQTYTFELSLEYGPRKGQVLAGTLEVQALDVRTNEHSAVLVLGGQVSERAGLTVYPGETLSLYAYFSDGTKVLGQGRLEVDGSLLGTASLGGQEEGAAQSLGAFTAAKLSGAARGFRLQLSSGSERGEVMEGQLYVVHDGAAEPGAPVFNDTLILHGGEMSTRAAFTADTDGTGAFTAQFSGGEEVAGRGVFNDEGSLVGQATLKRAGDLERVSEGQFEIFILLRTQR